MSIKKTCKIIFTERYQDAWIISNYPQNFSYQFKIKIKLERVICTDAITENFVAYIKMHR